MRLADVHHDARGKVAFTTVERPLAAMGCTLVDLRPRTRRGWSEDGPDGPSGAAVA
jgi:hypothetical protein